jgi:hypothetical protein
MTPDLPVAANTLLKQLREHVPAWSVAEPRHATGPLAFGGLSEQTDGEGKRRRIEIIEQVDSVLIRACHVDGRALVALWIRRSTRKGWTLDMAWRGRRPDEYAPQRITATQLKAYVAAPTHAAAIAAVSVTDTDKKEVAA